MFLIVSRFEISNKKKIRFFETAKVDDSLNLTESDYSGIGLRVRVFVRELQTRRTRVALLGNDHNKNHHPPIPGNQEEALSLFIGVVVISLRTRVSRALSQNICNSKLFNKLLKLGVQILIFYSASDIYPVDFLVYRV